MKNMKGVELPLNVMVVIAVVLLVLLGVLSLWMGGWGGQAFNVDLERVRSEACAELIRRGCADTSITDIWIYDFDADQDGVVGDAGDWFVICGQAPPGVPGDNLAQLCRCWYGIPSWGSTLQRECKKLCGCLI